MLKFVCVGGAVAVAMMGVLEVIWKSVSSKAMLSQTLLSLSLSSVGTDMLRGTFVRPRSPSPVSLSLPGTTLRGDTGQSMWSSEMLR